MNTNTYDPQTAKFAATVLTSMPEIPSDIMQGWIENPKGLRNALKGALCPPEEQKTAAPTFKTWRTLKLGTGIKDADGFRTALKEAKLNIGDWANDIIGKPAFTVSPEAREVELVNVSASELGFKGNATRADIYKRAQELGLDICPAEVGPQLRLQYTDQPKGEWLLIGMEPITDSDGDLKVFFVERFGGGKQWLGSDNGFPDFVWDADVRWVFLRRVNTIDLGADPFLPDGWKVETHQKGKVAKLERKGSDLYLDGKKIDFYLSKKQKGGSIVGNDLRTELAKQPVLNANVLDYLLKNPLLIPDEWKVDGNGNTRYIFFWGTVYRRSDGRLNVRYLYWGGGGWGWGCNWLDDGWVSDGPAAVSAS